ncbi:hydrogenase maturation protease [Microbispora sp. RL4-1S]|uniref:Hydrogenase maturation protease n=1 Tax=Microbispora oryzae TaxID=2806554 RepID=A0A941AJS9_9ACTN|nr:hydrogenase maturation protease [Microbispora oryzae]MBP2706526.1 hydrogenase maturation protease [Microbispora oryzae]
MRILVAGVGNVFLGDDGFGVAVAHRLAERDLPPQAEVGDFGIRGVHLAYELTSGYDLVIILDTVSRGRPPGTLYVLEPSPADLAPSFVDAHAMTPDAVLALAVTLATKFTGRILLVGCEPADASPGMELSPAVSGAVGRAADLVIEMIAQETGAPAVPRREEERRC